MNKLSFIGYLGSDCTTKHIGDFVAISFPVGVTNKWKNKQGEEQSKTMWVSCTIWRKPENLRISEFLKRGLQVYVEGEPAVRTWIKQDDNTAQGSLDCRVDVIEMLGKSKENNSVPAAQQQNTQASVPSQPITNNENDDLPF